ATLGTPNTAVVSILDDDVAGNIQLAADSLTVDEYAGVATVTVTRTGGNAGGVTVHYATSNGTATAGADYTGASGTLTFAANESSKAFTVAILNDTFDEGDETFGVTLSNPGGGATLGSPSKAVVTILDEDVAGSVQFSSATFTVNENAASATVTVTRTG